MSITTNIALANLSTDIVKNTGKQIFYQVSNSLCSRICADDKISGMVDDLCHVIYLMDKKKFKKHKDFINFNYKDSYSLQNNTRYIISLSKYTFVHIHAWNHESRDGCTNRNLDICIYGKDHKKVKTAIIDKMKHLQRPKRIRVANISERGADNYYGHTVIPFISFDQIILSKSVRQELISGISRWKQDKEWYRSHQLVHKLGILLYGPPGSGKTSIVKAISHYFNNAPIHYLTSIGDYEMSQISVARQVNDGIIIILIEDIDMLICSANRSDTLEKAMELKYEIKTNRMQRALFQLLDGMHSMDNIIYIATTNYIDQLDDGLIRPGRFDIKVEVPYFNEDLAGEMCQKFGYDREILNTLEVQYPIQPAKLQSMLMGVRSKELIEKEKM